MTALYRFETLLRDGGAMLTRYAIVFRYGLVGLLNTAFGYGLYALLIFVGLNLFVAQIVSHCTGALFNYFMFKRHVFRDSRGAIWRYLGAYGLNYFLGLALLAGVSHFVRSAYLAGFLALLAVAAINFFVLRFLVFTKPGAPTAADAL